MSLAQLAYKTESNRHVLYDKSRVRQHYAPGETWKPIVPTEFKTLRQIGKGTYGTVFQATAPSGMTVAIKNMKIDIGKQMEARKSIVGFPVITVREIYILKAIQHRNVVQLLDVITTPPRLGNGSGYKVSLVYEYMEHDLSGLWQNQHFHMDVASLKHFIKEILTGLQYVHEVCHIIHRDIKSSNILVNSRGEVKIADFGLAREYCEHDLNTNLVVTLWYRAPELLMGNCQHYGYKLDIWSLGCIFGELVQKEGVFKGKDAMDTFRMICQLCGTPDKESWPDYPKFLRSNHMSTKNKYPRVVRNRFKQKNRELTKDGLDLLDNLLQMNPEFRPSASEALNHPWFTESPRPSAPNLTQLKESHEYTYNARGRQKHR